MTSRSEIRMWKLGRHCSYRPHEGLTNGTVPAGLKSLGFYRAWALPLAPYQTSCYGDNENRFANDWIASVVAAVNERGTTYSA